MSQRRYEFPILKARRHEVENEYYRNKQHVERQSQAGNADSGTAAIMELYWQELQELNMVLNYFDELNYRETRQWQEWQTYIVVIVSAVSIALGVFYLMHGGG